MKVLYTEYEGGTWIPLEVEATKEDIVKELEMNHQHEIPLAPAVSHLTGKDDFVDVHSVLFPEGQVWDSYFGNFRPMDDKGLEHYKHIYNETLKHYERYPEHIPL